MVAICARWWILAPLRSRRLNARRPGNALRRAAERGAASNGHGPRHRELAGLLVAGGEWESVVTVGE